MQSWIITTFQRYVKWFNLGFMERIRKPINKIIIYTFSP